MDLGRPVMASKKVSPLLEWRDDRCLGRWWWVGSVLLVDNWENYTNWQGDRGVSGPVWSCLPAGPSQDKWCLTRVLSNTLLTESQWNMMTVRVCQVMWLQAVLAGDRLTYNIKSEVHLLMIGVSCLVPLARHLETPNLLTIFLSSWKNVRRQI